MVDTVGVTGEGTEAEIGTLVTLADIVGVMTGAGRLAETGANTIEVVVVTTTLLEVN